MMHECPSCSYKGIFPIPLEAKGHSRPETWVYCRRCDMNYGETVETCGECGIDLSVGETVVCEECWRDEDAAYTDRVYEQIKDRE